MKRNAAMKNGVESGRSCHIKFTKISRFSEDMGVRVLACGIRTRAEGPLCRRGLEKYHKLFLTLDGSAWVSEGEGLRRKRLGRSDWTLLKAGTAHAYEGIEQWTFAYVFFQGALIDRLFAVRRFFPCDNLYFRQATLDSERQLLCFIQESRRHTGVLGEVARNAWLTALVASVCRNYLRKRFPDNPLERAQQYIMDNLDKPITLEDLGCKAGMSPSTFSRVFRKFTGCAPIQLVNRLRIEQAQLLLRQYAHDIHITEVATRTGFADPYYFSRLFKLKTGLCPARYRAKFRIRP